MCRLISLVRVSTFNVAQCLIARHETYNRYFSRPNKQRLAYENIFVSNGLMDFPSLKSTHAE